MNESNYFQKGVVLIIAILLAIPNMRTYLVIGSYQTYSQSITANHYFEHPSARGKIPKSSGVVAAATLAIIGVFFAVSYVFSVAYAIRNHQQVAIGGRDIYAGRHILNFNTFDSSYRKYDFSEFDN